MLPTALAGLALGLSLIVAIGAQNLFVLRQGIRREHALLVAAVCAASDLALIALGVSGLGFVLTALPWLAVAVRWAGAAFLVGYGLLAAWRAWRPSGGALDAADSDAADSTALGVSTDATSAGAEAGPAGAERHRTGVRTRPGSPAPRRSASSVVLTCLALTWLNPHVYLDTVFLLGAVAATHGDQRWVFAAGAGLASIVWFSALAIGARHLGRWLRTPQAWRVLDAVIAVVMIVLGVSLVLPTA